MTSKLSGVPDLLLTLSTPGGGYGRKLAGVEFPVFHPCVRLAKWREHPGELSFIPPDGKFVLASYEVDLLPNPTYSTSASKSTQPHFPVSIEIKKSLGEYGNEFEIRILIIPPPSGQVSSTPLSPFPRAIGSRGSGTPAFGGSSNNPVVEDINITIPLAPGVKTLVNTKSSRGEWYYEKRNVTWKIPVAGGGGGGGGGNTTAGTATFRTGIVLTSSAEGEDDDEDEDSEIEDVVNNTGNYDDGRGPPSSVTMPNKRKEEAAEARLQSRKAKMAAMMPRSVLIGFSVKGWLASGVKVESLKVMHAKGMGEGVKPYKGVKYLTKAGAIEARC